MKSFIEHCRVKFYSDREKAGQAIPFVDRLRLPSWFSQVPEHPLKCQYDEQSRLYQHGQVVWGHLVQANKLLFEPGELDHPAAVVFSLDPYFDEFTTALADIARHIYAQKNLDDPDPAVAEFARIITDEFEVAFNAPIPKSRTVDRDVFYTAVVIQRSHLPDWVLKGSLFPYLVAPQFARATMILPHRYWPYKLW